MAFSSHISVPKLYIYYVDRFSLHCLPKIVRIKKPRELRFYIDHMNIAFLAVPYHGFVIFSCAICLNVDTKRAIYLELESEDQFGQQNGMASVSLGRSLLTS